MKVAVNIQTKKIIDVLPDIATSNTPFLINNGYIMLDIENPISNHIENEDGTVTTVFRELIEDDFKSYNEQNYKIIRQNIVDNIEVIYNEIIYQGDEKSQDRMSRAVVGMDDYDTIEWKAKDNSKVVLLRSELKQILKLSGIEQTKVWLN